jgi:SulP family sulfate permease
MSEESWPDEANFPTKFKEEVFIKHINGPLFFGSTSDFQQLIRQIPETASTAIIRMDKCTYIDQSGLYAMEDALQELSQNEVKVLLVKVQEQARYMLERIDIIPDLLPEEQIFDDYNSCIEWVKHNVADTHQGTA